MPGVPLTGVSPEVRKRCREIWDNMSAEELEEHRLQVHEICVRAKQLEDKMRRAQSWDPMSSP